jgi:hypothetical protein
VKKHNIEIKMSTQDEEKEKLFAHQRGQKLTIEQELEAIRLRAILFPAFTFYLAPPTSNFLKRMGLLWPNSKKLDTEVLIKIMIDGYKNNPKFFPIYMTNIEEILEEALLGRRAVAHGFLPLILHKGKHFLASWIAVANLLDQPEEANKLTNIYNQLYYGLHDIGRENEEPYARPNFVDAIVSRPGKISITEYECGLLVQLFLFKADNESLAPELRKHLISLRNGDKYKNSVMDTASYLWELFNRYTNRRYDYEKKQSDLTILHNAIEARNLLMHTEVIPLLNRHEYLFQSFIEVCKMLGLSKPASRITTIKNELANLLSGY